MKALLETIEAEFWSKLKKVQETLVSREVSFSDITSKIHVAIGMRRTGKTYVLFQKIIELQAEGVEQKAILYINFEDDRLLPISKEGLAEIVDAHYARFPELHDQKLYFFFDEIQNVDEWAQVVRRLFDTKDCMLFLSGSSAKLLSKEIATSLRGRTIATEVFPFSFKEYLVAKQIKLESCSRSKKDTDILKKELHHYLLNGGFPEIVLIKELDQQKTLQDYLELVLLRDIVERYNVKNISLMRYLIKAILKGTASLFSVNKLFNDIKSQGLVLSKNTLYDYVAYIEDAYLAFFTPVYSESLRKQQNNLRKQYAIDSGLVSACVFSFSENTGRLFENMCYLDIRRQGLVPNYYLTKERYEVDFITQKNDKRKLYQVCWDIENKTTLDREVRALSFAEKELGSSGELVTPDSYIEQLIETGSIFERG